MKIHRDNINPVVFLLSTKGKLRGSEARTTSLAQEGSWSCSEGVFYSLDNFFSILVVSSSQTSLFCRNTPLVTDHSKENYSASSLFSFLLKVLWIKSHWGNWESNHLDRWGNGLVMEVSVGSCTHSFHKFWNIKRQSSWFSSMVCLDATLLMYPDLSPKRRSLGCLVQD